MQILSKHSLVIYLNYILENNKNKHLFENFINLLDANFQKIKIYDIGLTRNSVFKIDINSYIYFFKQFGPNFKKGKDFFLNEIRINDKLGYPKIVYQDTEYNILIFESIVTPKNWTAEFKYSLKKPRNRSSKILLQKLAAYIKNIHLSGFGNSENHPFFEEVQIINRENIFYDLLPRFLELKNNNSFIHFDLKSENIFLENNDIKIIDWEMAGKGDIYFDLVRIIRTICTTIVDNHFFNIRNNYTSLNDVKYFVNLFLDAYDKDLCREKLNIFMKIVNIDLQENDNYAKNIDLILPFSLCKQT